MAKKRNLHREYAEAKANGASREELARLLHEIDLQEDLITAPVEHVPQRNRSVESPEANENWSGPIKGAWRDMHPDEDQRREYDD